ncbi:MAG: phosphatase PAP2 family protein [Actinobacteria bacterium]|nr:phosphatase PAP2 family protein [Actinomycetota bacterium]
MHDRAPGRERISALLRRSRRLFLYELVGLPIAALLVLAGSLWAFGTLVEDFLTGDPIVRLDARIASTLHAHAREPFTRILSVFTEVGGLVALVTLTLVAGGYLYARGRRHHAALLALAFSGAEVLTAGLKAGFHRDRPSFADPLATESTFSFPSGHALVALAVYGALAFVIASSLPSWRARAATFGVTGVLIVAIGFSRLYLGVHYLSDVLAGYSAGLVWLLVCVATVRLYRARRTL